MSLPRLDYPTYQTTLISTGEKVEYRPFIVKEHKILMTLKNAGGEEIARIITNLVEACTFNRIDIKRLSYFDIEYLFLQIRSKSIGETVDVRLKCGNCNMQVNTSYNIDDVRVVKNDTHTNKIELSKDTGIIMKYPSIERAIGLFNDSEDSESMDWLILNSIEAIYDKDNYWTVDIIDESELKDFINNLQKKHFDMIENFFITSPKIVQDIEAKCGNCDIDINVKLEGLYNFFV